MYLLNWGRKQSTIHFLGGVFPIMRVMSVSRSYGARAGWTGRFLCVSRKGIEKF